MRTIVINRCHGGFGLTDEALDYYNSLTGLSAQEYWGIQRDDPFLIQTINHLGAEAAGGKYSQLVLVDIPEDVRWEIGEYDGMEWVAEQHRTWS